MQYCNKVAILQLVLLYKSLTNLEINFILRKASISSFLIFFRFLVDVQWSFSYLNAYFGSWKRISLSPYDVHRFGASSPNLSLTQEKEQKLDCFCLEYYTMTFFFARIYKVTYTCIYIWKRFIVPLLRTYKGIAKENKDALVHSSFWKTKLMSILLRFLLRGN